MVRSRIVYGLLVIICLVFSMVYKSNVTAVLLLIMLSYPIVAAALTAIQLIFIKAEFPVQRIICEKNVPFEYYIAVKNNSVFPCAPLEIVCFLPDPDTGVFGRRRIYASFSPFGSARLAIEGRHVYRGCYQGRIMRVAAVDPLRIIRISKKAENDMVMVFLPQRIDLEDIASTSVGEDNYTVPDPLANDREEFSHVRDYREGDIMQMVHWKLTAKQDELMIKQFESINDRRALILCDWNSGEGDALLRTDTIIETAIAFVKNALDAGIHSTIDIGGASDREPVSVSNVGEFDSFFDLMSVLPVNTGKYDFSAVIDETDVGSAALVVLITPYLSEEVIARARAISSVCVAYLVYINLAQRQVEQSLFEDDFMFMNVRGTGSDALRLAAAMARRDE